MGSFSLRVKEFKGRRNPKHSKRGISNSKDSCKQSTVKDRYLGGEEKHTCSRHTERPPASRAESQPKTKSLLKDWVF